MGKAYSGHLPTCPCTRSRSQGSQVLVHELTVQAEVTGTPLWPDNQGGDVSSVYVWRNGQSQDSASRGCRARDFRKRRVGCQEGRRGCRTDKRPRPVCSCVSSDGQCVSTGSWGRQRCLPAQGDGSPGKIRALGEFPKSLCAVRTGQRPWLCCYHRARLLCYCPENHTHGGS